MATNFSTLPDRSLFLNFEWIKPKLDQFRSQAADEKGTLNNLDAIGQSGSFDAIPCHHIARGQVKLILLINPKKTSICTVFSQTTQNISMVNF